MKHKTIESRVLSIYRKVSPSFIDIENKTVGDEFLIIRKRLFRILGICEQLFNGKSLLDIGAGTGEKSLHYASLGAKITLVEPNQVSCSRARNLFKEKGLEHKSVDIVNTGLYDINPSLVSKFDIVICDGVLHHTYSPAKGLELILNNMKSGASLLLSMAETAGCMKRTLQRKLIYSVAGDNEDAIAKASLKYFNEHIKRAARHGQRSLDAVIYDSYVNPQVQPTDLKTLCNLFLKYKFTYISSMPSLKQVFNVQPWANVDPVNGFDYNKNKDYYAFLEKVWACSGDSTSESKELKKMNLPQFSRRVERDYKNLLNLAKKIRAKKFSLSDLKPVRSGHNGVGNTYFFASKD